MYIFTQHITAGVPIEQAGAPVIAILDKLPTDINTFVVDVAERIVRDYHAYVGEDSFCNDLGATPLEITAAGLLSHLYSMPMGDKLQERMDATAVGGFLKTLSMEVVVDNSTHIVYSFMEVMGERAQTRTHTPIHLFLQFQRGSINTPIVIPLAALPESKDGLIVDISSGINDAHNVGHSLSTKEQDAIHHNLSRLLEPMPIGNGLRAQFDSCAPSAHRVVRDASVCAAIDKGRELVISVVQIPGIAVDPAMN